MTKIAYKWTAVLAAALLLVGLMAGLAAAANQWPTTAVCQWVQDQTNVQMIADGAGGIIAVWQDYRNGTDWNIYASRLDADGGLHTGWTPGGNEVCTEAMNQIYPTIASDGAGGAIIAWQDSRYNMTTAPDIFAQRLDGGDGHQLWDPGNDIEVSVTTGNQTIPKAAPDTAGGAVITWRDSRGGFANQDIYALRLNSNGTTAAGWVANGTIIGEADPSDSLDVPMIVADGSNGACVVYELYDGSHWQVYAQKVNSSGVVQWGPNEGKLVREVVGSDGVQARIATDGSGGALMTWSDGRLSWDNLNIYAQRVYSNGTTWATEDGVEVCGADGEQDAPELVSDGAHGAVITWSDNRNSATTKRDIYAQRVLNTGAMSWTSDGVPLSTAAADQWNPEAASDGSGGAVVAWMDERGHPGNYDIYARRVTQNGTRLWTDNGILVRTGSPANDGMNQVAAGDGGGGGFFAWEDNRDDVTTGWDIYAQYVTGDAPTVTGITPDEGNNNGTVQITNLSGANFAPGAVVELRKTGQSAIAGTSVDVVSGTQITCRFDLTGAAIGARDVYVRNNDGQFHTLANAFTVEYPPPTVSGIFPSSAYTDSRVEIENLWGTGFRSGAKVELLKNGESKIAATDVKVVSSKKITCEFDLKDSAVGKWNVKVKNPDGKSGVKNNAFTVEEVPGPAAEDTWYLAEGTTDWGFTTYVTIENPNYVAVTTEITYYTDEGEVSGGVVSLQPMSQAVVNPRDTLGAKDFSTKVECREEKPIAVDRRMIWAGPGAPCTEGHASIGVTDAAKQWYLAEGSSKWGFETWLLIQNPGTQDADVTVTYMTEDRGPIEVEKQVKAGTRSSYSMADDIGEADASIAVESNRPVIPERAMYRNNRREGHDSIGTIVPAQDFYLAEGTTDWGFTTYVLVQNPNDEATVVNITFMTPTGPQEMPAFEMAPQSRRTVNVNTVVPKADLSTWVHADKPIIAERAMYWGAGTPLGEACHDSIGMPEPHKTFYFPDGETSNGTETWTLVQNPNDEEVLINVQYLTPTGEGNKFVAEVLPANSRISFNMADMIPDGRAAVLVFCTTTDKKIMAERAMYWGNRGAGTDTIGGFNDL